MSDRGYNKGYEDGFSDGANEKMDTTTETIKKHIYSWIGQNYPGEEDLLDFDNLAAHIAENLEGKTTNCDGGGVMCPKQE